jgi:hypothetical protein
LENTVLIDYQCRQPVFFRARHFVSPPNSKRSRRMILIATGASNFFAREDSPANLRLLAVRAFDSYW